jgi:hypothetical protein
MKTVFTLFAAWVLVLAAMSADASPGLLECTAADARLERALLVLARVDASRQTEAVIHVCDAARDAARTCRRNRIARTMARDCSTVLNITAPF